MIDPDEKATATEEDEVASEETEEQEDPLSLDPLGPPGGRPW
jgi:hypothetical protein